MSKHNTSIWQDVSIKDLDECYHVILNLPITLTYQDWIKFIIIKEKHNKTWYNKIDNKIKHKEILPSLVFIWYAYEHLNSTQTFPVHIVREILAETPKYKEKEKQKRREQQKRRYLARKNKK